MNLVALAEDFQNQVFAPQVAKMSVTNAKISVTKFASKCHKL